LTSRERKAREVEEALAMLERERLAADRPRVLEEHRKAVRDVVTALPPLMKANARLRALVGEYGALHHSASGRWHSATQHCDSG
jgi:hypothetical protein